MPSSAPPALFLAVALPLVALPFALGAGAPPAARGARGLAPSAQEPRSEKGTQDPADEGAALPTLAAKTANWEARAGFLPLHIDADRGRVCLEIPRERLLPGERLILSEALVGGLGSNDVGLDRALGGTNRLVRFERVGRRVLLLEENTRFRAEGGDADEQRAVEESFARSVLWSFEVLAADQGTVLLDATGFAQRDALSTAQRLKEGGEGNYELDAGRSAPILASCRAFPANTDLEAWITLATKEGGGSEAKQVAPDPRSLTLRQRQSFLALPPSGYRPRVHDPRMASLFLTFSDYASPLDEPLEKRWILRHRLEKLDPRAERSPVKEPIVYYLDRGVPEPIRTALLEGARWWEAAFAAAGFENAFRVEMLPAEVDPADVRYNLIVWVHRSTRGWSYGGSVIDPRTGEILRGVVRLGSLRVRQDVLLARGLLGPDAERPLPDGNSQAVSMALARLRQLSAHELGHTLGFSHNFAASTQGRASVMDYPAPLVRIEQDTSLDLGDAYAVGLGPWDHASVAWAYSEFPPGVDERAGLEAIVESTRRAGLRFLTDADARPDGALHPHANLWDNAEDGLSELRHAIQVRNLALARLGPSALPPGRPLAELEEILVPVYLHHRYALAACAKMIGGAEYRYALAGEDDTRLRTVAPDTQRAALDAMLSTLRPEFLRLPPGLAEHIPPRPPGSRAHRELFPRAAAPAFDGLAPARVQIEQTLALLLDPQRAQRLIEQPQRAANQLGFDELVDRLTRALAEGAESALSDDLVHAEMAQAALLEQLADLGGDPVASLEVRAVARRALRDFAWHGSDSFNAWILARRDQLLTRPEAPAAKAPRASVPPGSPIGAAQACGCGIGWLASDG